MPINAGAVSGRKDWQVHGFQHIPDREIAFFRCPNCEHVESSSCGPFQYTDLDHKIKCNACEKKTKVAVWKCGCDQFWHRCPLHRESISRRSFTSMLLKTKQQTSANAGAGKETKTTRQLGPDSHEWLLAEDVAREKRKRDLVDNWDDEPTITLGLTRWTRINPFFLGPKLKRRFLDASDLPLACSSSSIAQ